MCSKRKGVSWLWRLGLLATLAFCVRLTAQKLSPLLIWQISDESSGDAAVEQAHHADGKISGVYLRVLGVQGGALRLDGETSGVLVDGKKVPCVA